VLQRAPGFHPPDSMYQKAIEGIKIKRHRLLISTNVFYALEF